MIPQWVFLLVPLLWCCEGGRVLFLPSTFFPSHAIPMKALAEKLASGGHDVHWLEYSPKQSVIELSSSVKREHWQVPLDEPILSDLLIHNNSTIDEWQIVWNTHPSRIDQAATNSMIIEAKDHTHTIPISAWLASIRLCDKVLSHKKKEFDHLIQENFDTIIVDDQFNPCGLLLSSLKGAVFVYWSQSAMRPEAAWAHQSPSPPSYLPVPGTKLTEDMNFWERSYNLASYFRALYVHQHIIQPRIDAVLQRHYPDAPSAFTMERNASLNFVNTPPIFDFARPFMPRVVFVGCIHCRKPEALPSALSSFLDGGKFMVASFGFRSHLTTAPEQIRSMFFNALTSRPGLKFVVQYDGDDNLPDNVIALPFLPLQDLLGHDNCVGHISHGGLNSVVESVWHGVPVVGIPLVYPAYDNLLRLSARGAAYIVDKAHLSLHHLTQAIDTIQRKKYKDEMLVFQDMVRDVPYTELDHATFWIEFIERHHEIPHARSGADKLNIFQYFLIDVAIFCVSVTFIVSYLTFAAFRFIFGLCFRRKRSSEMENKKKRE